MTDRTSLVLAVLEDVREFLNDQSDVVDGDYGVPAPNRAMTLLMDVDNAIRAMEG